MASKQREELRKPEAAVVFPHGEFDCSRMQQGWYEPPPAVCAFCGRELGYSRMCLEDGTFLCWEPQPERCSCGQAAAWWAALEERERMQAAEEQAQKSARLRQEVLENALGRSGLPAELCRRDFASFETDTPDLQRSFDLCRGYAESFGTRREAGDGLLIRGGVGVGKTHLAAAIALHIMRSSLGTVIWRGERELMLDFRSAYAAEGHRTEKEILHAYLGSDLLIIDDFGKDRISGWSAGIFFSVLNGRCEMGRSTVLTTNLSDAEIAAKLGCAEQSAEEGGGWTSSAIMSRLSDMRRFMRVRVRGRDRRAGSAPPDWVRAALCSGDRRAPRAQARKVCDIPDMGVYS